MKTVTLPMMEVWDRDPKKNKSRYPGKEIDFLAVKQIYTGTEFVTWYIDKSDMKYSWLLKLFSYLNGIK